MIDPIVNLAFSMHKTPGLYALLLGSGISKSVGIPTGQEIRDDLARQVKEISGTELSEDIGYDELLKQLGKTQAERNAILRPYFEPTDEEREQKLKIPSPAHHAIAQLISSGHIRVVLTTNFDRLLEQALANLGITPNVIRSDDMLEGAMPLRHSPITIVQLHGDYLDLRMLNTPEELSDYSDSKKRLLETIFDEYGLIVCGWSARWDTALRNALLRVKSRRYSTYWVEPNNLSPEAQDLVMQRDATPIQEAGDTFFKKLADNVDSLARMNREHPLTIAVAVDRVKKWIPDESKHIELEDLIRNEAEHAYQRFSQESPDNEALNAIPSKDLNAKYIQYYLSQSEVSLHAIYTICWYGKGKYIDLVRSVLERWAELPESQFSYGFEPRKLPALLVLYICGITAIYQAEWRYLKSIVDTLVIYRHEQRQLLLEINKNRILDYRVYYPHRGDFDPGTKLIRESIQAIFGMNIPKDKAFVSYVDTFEMIIDLLSQQRFQGGVSHNATIHDYSYFSGTNIWNSISEFWRAGAKSGKAWMFLELFFDGDVNQLVKALNDYQTRVTEKDRTIPKMKIPDLASIYSTNFKTT